MPESHQVNVQAGAGVRLDVQLFPRVTRLADVVVRPAAAGLTGLIHDHALQPVPGARISVYGTRFRGIADDRGRFRMGSVPPGSYLVRVTSSHYEPRMFSVVIPPEGGRDVSIQVDTRTGARRNMAEIDWADASQRRRWASRSQTLFMVAQELASGGRGRLSDVSEIMTLVGHSEPCVYVDGRQSPLPLQALYVEDVEAVEVYPARSVAAASLFRPGGAAPRPTALERLGITMSSRDVPIGRGCSGAVMVWLKQS